MRTTLKLIQHIVAISLALFIVTTVHAVQLPPKNVLTKFTGSGKSFLVTVEPWQGVRYKEVLSRELADVSGLDLLDLVPGFNEVDGFGAWHKGSAHSTSIELEDRSASIGRVLSSIQMISTGSAPHDAIPRLQIGVNVKVFRTSDEARQFVEQGLRFVQSPDALISRDLKMGLAPGDICWKAATSSSFRFVRGRAVVIPTGAIRAGPASDQDALWELVEGVAQRVDYALLRSRLVSPEARRKESLKVRFGGTTLGDALRLGNTTMAPAQIFRTAGISITRREGRTILSWKQKQLSMQPYGWFAKLGDQLVRLSKPVIIYDGEVILPIEDCARALGLTIESKRGTLVLKSK